MAEEEKEEKFEAETKKSNVKLVWGLNIVMIIVLFVILIIMKLVNPDISTGKLFIWGFGLSAFFALVAGGFHYYNLRKDRKIEEKEEKELKLPKAIDDDIARKLAHRMLEDNYFEYFSKIKFDGSGQFGQSGRSSIYTIIGQGLYTKQWYGIVINQNYPKRNKWIGLLTLETEQTRDPVISRIQNRMAADPEESPATETTRSFDPVTGREFTRTRKEPSSKRTKKTREGKKLDI